MAQASKSENLVLEVVARQEIGTGAASSLRREGWIPGIVYGEGKTAQAVQVALRELKRALQTKAGENVLISLHLKAGVEVAPEKTVLIEELQRHPVTHQILHVDFHQISLTKRIKVAVPLTFQGEAIGVKQEGGILEHLRWDLEVECLPTQIPAEIPVDVSGLAVGKSLSAKEVALPGGVRLVTDPELPVVSCIIPKMEEAAPAPAEVAESTEPEVIKQKKPEEGAAEGAAAGEKAAPGGQPKEGKPKS